MDIICNNGLATKKTDHNQIFNSRMKLRPRQVKQLNIKNAIIIGHEKEKKKLA